MKFPRFPALLVSIMAANAASTAALAQAESADSVAADSQSSSAEVLYIYGTRSSYREDESSSVTRTPTSLEDIPQSVYVITRDVIDDQAMNGLGELVRYVPGVTMGQGEGHRDAPIFRGNITTSDFFTDGVRDDLQYLRDLYNVDRVDVIKGSSALAFGRGNGGGALNRVSKIANGDRQVGVDFGAGSFGYSRIATDIGGEISSSVAGRLNVFAEDSNSYRDELKVDRRGFAPTVRIQASADTQIDLFAEHFVDERTVDRGVPSQNGRPWTGATDTFFGNSNLSNSEIDVSTLRGLVTHQLSSDVTFRGMLSYGDYSKFYDNVFAGGPVDGTNNSVLINSYNNGTDRTNLMGQADLIWDTTLGGFDHSVLIGLEAGRQESENLRVNTESAVFSLADRGRDFTPDFTVAPARNNTNDLDLFAVLVQDQIQISDTVQAVLGVRLDRFDLRFDDRRPGSTDFAREDDFVSPRIGLVWEAIPGLSFFSGWSLAYLPQSGEQFSSLSATTAALEPEEFENAEIGVRWLPSDRLLVSATVYQLDRNNTRAPGLIPGEVVLTGSQRSEGFEFSIQGELAEGWNLIGAMALQNAEITSTTSSAAAGQAAPLVPDRSASLWNRVSLTDSLDIGVGVIHQGEQYASISNAVVLPSYTRFDAALFYNVNDRYDIQLNIENLTDKNYWFTAHNDNNITPGSPIAARLTLSARF